MARTQFPFAPLARAAVVVLAPVSLAAGLAACGSSNATPSSTTPAAAESGSCSRIAGAHHARVVVETAPGKTLARCVGFSTPTISAVKLLADSRIELGTESYSFGLAVCQVDNVPAHYSQCLPSGQDYWALFVSSRGRAWTSANTGISATTLKPGDSLGLRYDSPKGTAAPPPPPSPA